MTEEGREADGVVLQALDALADGGAVDWATLASDAGGDEEARRTLDVLHAIAGIVRAHAPVRASVPAVPFRWGPLDVQAHLARGAHGDVYRGRDLRLDREVALKLLRQDESLEAAPLTITEGSLLARVRHPNVVAVYGADRIDGQAGIWMEFVEGETLQARLEADGPLPVAEVLEAGVAVCAGLAAVHAAGLVHRDVKAQNVMRDRSGRTMLMDLGAGEDHADTRVRLEGTPLYLAPELLEGGRATVASDIYAVGVLLHVLATGRYPVTGNTLDELRAHHHAAHRTGVARDGVPAGLASVIDRAMAPRAADRYASALAMQQALMRPTQRRPARRVATVLALGAGLGVAILGGLAMVASDQARSPVRLVSGTAEASRVIPLPPYPTGPLSADGRFVPYVDSRGDVHRLEVATGRSHVVVRADDATGRATAVLLSRDASGVAYAWRRPDGTRELRTVRADGSRARVLLQPQRAYTPTPLDWSSDDRHVLCTLRQHSGAIDVVLVTGEYGAPPRLLLASPSGGTVTGALSADGRFAAVSIDAGTDADGLHLVDITSGAARRIVNSPVTLPRFATDDRQLFFVRPHDGMDALWSLPMVEGTPAGEAALLVPTVGGLHDVRVSGDNVLYRLSGTVSAEVYTARFDARGSKPPGTPARLDPTEIGNHVGPAWSPDGRHLAYFTIRQTVPGLTPARTLTLRDMTTGEVRRLSVPLVFLGGYTPRWSTDGRHVAVWGRDGATAASWGYFRVDVTSGEAVLLVRMGINAPAYAQFTPDGRAFCYTDPRRGIISRDLASGREDVVVQVGTESRPGRFAITSDGDAMAFVRIAGSDDAITTTLEVQRQAQRPVVRARATFPDWLTLQAWTPDGAHLLFARGRDDARSGLWRIGAASGAPVDLEFGLIDGPNVISLHPDGQRVAWAERILSPELWISRLPTR